MAASSSGNIFTAMDQATSTPYVSTILTGRNDTFGGDFNVRLFRALEFNRHHLSKRGIRTNFTSGRNPCDWRDPVDLAPLRPDA
jgi:hypothetical protein